MLASLQMLEVGKIYTVTLMMGTMYQNVPGVMGTAYNPFLNSEAGNAYMNFEVAELLKFRTEKIIEIDPTEKERPSLGLSH